MTSTLAELKDGTILSGVVDVEWLHQNLFVALVRAAPSVGEDAAATELPDANAVSGTGRRSKHADGDVRALQFELTQCSVPTGSHSLLSSTIRRVLRHAHRVGDMSLRLDIVSMGTGDSGSRECFGDLVYGENRCGSLQRDLLALGVARVIRPGFETRVLIKAEGVAMQSTQTTFSTVIYEYETSAQRRVEVRGVVLDAMRGHWIRVGELQSVVLATSAEQTSTIPLPEWLWRKGTLLAQLDCLDCDEELPLVWATGFDAARFTQEFLVGCAVRLVVHESVPADKELSNNTQEIEYDQLAHVKATVYVEPSTQDSSSHEYLPRTTHTSGGGGASLQLRRGRWGRTRREAGAEVAAERRDHLSGSAAEAASLLWARVDEWLHQFRGDWARVLLRAGLARLCPPLDFCAPRSENYCSLLLDVQELAALHAQESQPLSLRQLWEVFLPHRLHEGPSVRSSGCRLRWDGMLRWEDVAYNKQHLTEQAASENAQQPPSAHPTSVLGSDAGADDPCGHMWKHRWTPLKFLCSFEELLVEPAGPNISGFITQMARLSFSTASDELCSCVSLSVAVTVCDTVVERLRKEHRAESRGSISVSPPSMESANLVNARDAAELLIFAHFTDADCWPSKLRFTASYDPELSGLDAKSCEAHLSIASFSADHPLTQKELYQALADGRHGSLTLDLLQSSGVELSLPAGSERRLFVVECRIRCDGEGVTSARAFYILSHNGKKREDEHLLGKGGVDAAPYTRPTGVDAGAVADVDEEEVFEMADREAEAPHTEVEEGDAVVQNGDAKPKAESAIRQILPTSSSPTSPPSSGAGADASPQGLITMHHALIDVLLPLPKSTIAILDDDADGVCVWRDITKALLFKSVNISLTHIVFVAGRRCFMVESVSSPTDPTLCSWVSKHLLDNAALCWEPPALAPSLRGGEEGQGVPSSVPVAKLQPRFGRPASCVIAEQHGAFARPLLPHIFTAAGTHKPGCHTPGTEPNETIPLLTLTPFAIGLRQLFASHPKQHRNVITETERSTASGWAHVDAAFMRLRFPRLPCYLRSNLEWLPPLVQDALTDVVALDLSKSTVPASKDNTQTPVSSPVVPPEVSLLCMERPFAALLSSLLMLAPLGGNAPLPRELRDPAVRANFRLDISGFRSTAVLYCADRDERGELHERQGTREACGREDGKFGSALVFASRRTVEDSAFDPHVVLPIKLPPKVTQRLLVALAMESATCVEDDALDEADRVLGETSFTRRPLRLAHWLYQPTAVGGIGVLGEPLVTVPRECLTELHSGAHSAPGTAGSGAVPLCYQYIAVRSATAANPYRFVSYGQLNRNMLVQHQARQWKRGRHVLDYVTLMLRQCNAAGGTPAGLLKAYGNAFEPLYLHYVSRDSMRRQIAYGWDLFRSSAGVEELEREEARLWERLLRFAKALLRRVADAVQGVPVLLSMDCRLANPSRSTVTADGDEEGAFAAPSPPTSNEQTSSGTPPPTSPAWSFLVINVFPIESLSAAPASPSSRTSSSSCRDFLMRENVYGRLPTWQVHVQHVGGDAWFSYTVERLKS